MTEDSYGFTSPSGSVSLYRRHIDVYGQWFNIANCRKGDKGIRMDHTISVSLLSSSEGIWFSVEIGDADQR
jgi:hypothetical protein